jgi:transcriptional regulator GlxA family with amidase domain
MITLRKTRFAFLTLQDYSFIALATAVEPLRMANSLSGQLAYEWVIVSLDGQPVTASNGWQLTPTVSLADMGRVDILFVCGGTNVQRAVSPRLLAALRRQAGKQVPLGALCTGGYALAHAGLLDRYKATIHWENLSALREEFPHVQLSDQLFTIDRDRYTCSGGIAPLDLMLNLIRVKLGARVAELISEQFIVERAFTRATRCSADAADEDRAADGRQYRTTIGVGGHRAPEQPVAAPDRAAVQAAPGLRTETLLPDRAAAPGARIAAAHQHAHR